MQWLGLGIILVSYYLFSGLGRREGISFSRNRWIYCSFLTVFFGAASGLYDKLLIQRLGYTPLQVQAWSNLYLVIVLGIVVASIWIANRRLLSGFTWRWSIPLIGFASDNRRLHVFPSAALR